MTKLQIARIKRKAIYFTDKELDILRDIVGVPVHDQDGQDFMEDLSMAYAKIIGEYWGRKR